MPTSIAPLMTDQRLGRHVFFLSPRLEGKLTLIVELSFFSSSRWDTWAQGSTVDKGRRQGGNLTHFRCAGGSVPFDFNYYPSLLLALVISCFRVDTLKRWCATEVDSDGAMVPVSFSSISSNYLHKIIADSVLRANGVGAKAVATRTS